MIRISDLSFSYGEKQIADHWSCTLPTDGLTALCGHSGCGKTTLLRLLAGLEIPAGGSIEGIAGNQTAILFQEDRLLPWRTVSEHISDAFPEHVSDLEKWLDFAELADEADSYPDQLSGGMARRLALTRCCAVCKAKNLSLLLLDEPFTGVDTECRKRLLKKIRGLDVPAILVTHDMDTAGMCESLVRLDGPPLCLAG